jgi:hypothetical protein
MVNKVASSGLITLKLEDYWPENPLASFDLKDYLYMELILKEKDFRAAIKELDFGQYAGKVLCVYCSADAIIPAWAYMVVAAAATPHVADIYQGTEAEYLRDHYRRVIRELDPNDYAGQRIVIKGCGDREVPAAAYLEVTAHLRPAARSIMFGEPCSTVPVYKQPLKRRQAT